MRVNLTSVTPTPRGGGGDSTGVSRWFDMVYLPGKSGRRTFVLAQPWLRWAVVFVVLTNPPFPYQRPKWAPPSTYRMCPVTVAASVRNRTAFAISWTVEGRPMGDRLSITSFGVFRCSGV